MAKEPEGPSLRLLLFPQQTRQRLRRLRQGQHTGGDAQLRTQPDLPPQGVGIGALILHYGDLMITDRLMAGVIVLSLLGLLFNLFLQWLERKAIPWKNI